MTATTATPGCRSVWMTHIIERCRDELARYLRLDDLDPQARLRNCQPRW